MLEYDVDPDLELGTVLDADLAFLAGLVCAVAKSIGKKKLEEMIVFVGEQRSDDETPVEGVRFVITRKSAMRATNHWKRSVREICDSIYYITKETAEKVSVELSYY